MNKDFSERIDLEVHEGIEFQWNHSIGMVPGVLGVDEEILKFVMAITCLMFLDGV